MSTIQRNIETSNRQFAGLGLAFALASLSPISSTAEVVWSESIIHTDDNFQFGNQANANSTISPYFSGCSRVASSDGRYVVFSSDASNLVRNDNNHQTDVFLRDTVSGHTRRISVATDGSELTNMSEAPCISSDGRYITYQTRGNITDEPNHAGDDVYLYDRIENSQRLVSIPSLLCTVCEGDNVAPVISGDGNWIVFESNSVYLGAFSEMNPGSHIVRYERSTGRLDLISVSTDGDIAESSSNHPSISDNGRFISFDSAAENLVAEVPRGFPTQVYLRDSVLESTTLVSKAFDGTPGDSLSSRSTVSTNGEYVAFTSSAANLVGDDTNGANDAFVYRVGFESVERVSVASDGTEGSIGTRSFSNVQLSGDGSAAVFVSESPELAGVAGPIDLTVFHHDRNTGITTPIGPVADTGSGATFRRAAMLNDDGSAVWIATEQDDLVANDRNGALDVIRFDMSSGVASMISRPHRNLVAASGPNAPTSTGFRGRTITADGRYIVFSTAATNLEPGPFAYPDVDQVVLLDRLTRYQQPIVPGTQPTISADGRYVAFASSATDLVPNDNNDKTDIFVYDRATEVTQRINVNSFGAEADDFGNYPVIAANGRHVVFESRATNLVSQAGTGLNGLYLHDLDAGTTEQIVETGDFASVSADGRYVAFASSVDDLIVDDTNGFVDIFVLDRVLQVVRRVSVSTADEQSDDNSSFPQISDDGRVVVFTSDATNLISPPLEPATQTLLQQYAHEITTGVTELVSRSFDGEVSDGRDSYLPSVSGDGRFVVWSTDADNLTAAGATADSNGERDLYLRDRQTDLTRRVSTDRFGTLGATAYDGLTRTFGANHGTLSADGRFVIVSSDYNNLHLDAGRYMQTDDINDWQGFLMELPGFAEPASIQTIDLSTLGAEVGVPVTIPIMVTGDASAPLDGVASIEADSGEVCLQTDRTTVNGQSNARRFECEITFRTRGEHELSLGFSVSQTHESTALLIPITAERPAGDPNQPPTAESQSLTVAPNTPRPIALLADDPDGDVLTFSLFNPPTNGSLSGTPPNVTYTPDAGFIGNDSFTFGVTDGIDNSGPATITLEVSANPVPVADSQTQTLDEDTSLPITLTGISSTGGALTYTVTEPPVGGTLAGTVPDLIYTPAADYFGVDTLMFTVNDGSGESEPATVNLIVDPINDPPSFTAGPSVTYPDGSSGDQTEQGWATDISPGPRETDVVSFDLSRDDPDGVITDIAIGSTGTLSVTLTGIAGMADVEAIAIDSEGAESTPALFTITVDADGSSNDALFANGFEL